MVVRSIEVLGERFARRLAEELILYRIICVSFGLAKGYAL